MPQTKEEKNAKKREWYQINKVSIAARTKAYQESHKAEISAQKKAHYQEHREERRAAQRLYDQKNKDKRKDYRKNHKEEIKDYNKAYFQTQNGKKLNRINNWKQSGIISDDWDALYERYINTHWCDNCEVALTEDSKTTPTTRCMDHDHSITDKPNVRNVLCNACNLKRG
tara:strand:+ start:40 stop:549 length:510 start_codon:yes stop_codon:yes gene_type:complete